jgi:hypothetical protein
MPFPIQKKVSGEHSIVINPAEAKGPPIRRNQYGMNDILLFDNDDVGNLFLGVLIQGPIVELGDFNCVTNSASGIDGDTLGFIAIALSWLAYSVYVDSVLDCRDDGLETGTPIRSLHSEGSDYNFQVYLDWQPIGNCTITCILLDGAPHYNWSTVGNGIYQGVFHELHFTYTDKFIGYKATQAVNPGDSALATRYYITTGNQPASGNGIYANIYTLKR